MLYSDRSYQRLLVGPIRNSDKSDRHLSFFSIKALYISKRNCNNNICHMAIKIGVLLRKTYCSVDSDPQLLRNSLLLVILHNSVIIPFICSIDGSPASRPYRILSLIGRSSITRQTNLEICWKAIVTLYQVGL